MKPETEKHDISHYDALFKILKHFSKKPDQCISLLEKLILKFADFLSPNILMNILHLISTSLNPSNLETSVRIFDFVCQYAFSDEESFSPEQFKMLEALYG